jgi:hypothetical protein
MGGIEVQLYPFMTTALEEGEGSAIRPGHSLPPGKTQYPLYRRLGGAQGQSGQVQKILPPPPGFDPQTVKPEASRYTDYATWPTAYYTYLLQMHDNHSFSCATMITNHADILDVPALTTNSFNI